MYTKGDKVLSEKKYLVGVHIIVVFHVRGCIVKVRIS